jgi:hypothetical protein
MASDGCMRCLHRRPHVRATARTPWDPCQQSPDRYFGATPHFGTPRASAADESLCSVRAALQLQYAYTCTLQSTPLLRSGPARRPIIDTREPGRADQESGPGEGRALRHTTCRHPRVRGMRLLVPSPCEPPFVIMTDCGA